MMTLLRVLLIVHLGLVSVGCRHTWQGVKTDTRQAVKKTGTGIKKAGQKIENAVK